MKVHHALPKPVIFLFFVIGITAATCFRILIVFKWLAPELFRPVWYVGVFGYLAFFLYRYIITTRRRHAIMDSGILDKLTEDRPLTAEEKENTLYLLRSIVRTKEHWNYLAIFILSILAIAVDITLSITVGG